MTSTFEEIPQLKSDSLHKIYTLIDEIKADEVIVVLEQRGCKKARTSIRTKLSQITHLCKQARKDIPSQR